ncbi:MAG: ABC transporter permease [Candidatus Marinimicrobia bacterium]|nr:ABC transporter permease [Candidatus Neomarinimicrobiota bacterium]
MTADFNFNSLIWKELYQRKGRLLSGLLTISLGIAVILGIHSITSVSKQLVAEKLDLLGANILVLPQGASASDYYSADVDAPTIPEDYVEHIATSMLPGVDNLSPKLSRSIQINDTRLILTGILPVNELSSKPIWQSSDLMGIDLQTACGSAKQNESTDSDQKQAIRAIIESLSADEVWMGSLAAQELGKGIGTTIDLEGHTFKVTHVLPETGTIEDSRIFAHLHTVQELLGTGAQISAIEIMGCCNAISDGLLGKLRNILPDTRVTSIAHIVNTQVETNRMMSRISIILLIIIIIVGSFSIGNYMWANVEERRKELGTYITVGFKRYHIYKLFLIKSTLLGIAGGIIGYTIGTLAAMFVGYMFTEMVITPVAQNLIWSILVAILITTLGTLYPVHRAVRIDPALIMQEI